MEGRYTFETGLDGVRMRLVRPYEFEYRTSCKLPWRNKPLLTIFRDHFKAYSEDYYRNAIVSGSITVSGRPVTLLYKLKNGDTIEHRTTRQEPPVLDLPISIEFDLPSILVVCKPPSMPTHLCGAYHHNSLVSILENERGIRGLKPIHRLDRVTSGLIVFAKNSQTASQLTELMKKEECEKWYVAKVKGEFPSGEIKVNAGIKCVNKAEGRYGLAEDGKESETWFYKERYFQESDMSVVRCRPVTGRTHQIRLHLQSLNFPIANDDYYGGTCADLSPDPHHGTKRMRITEGSAGIEMEETKQMMIFLHAFRYKLTQNLDFEVTWPKWALGDVSEY